MGVTLATFQTQLRYRLGIPSSDGLFDGTVLTALINMGLHAVENEADWPWLEKVDTPAIGSAAGYIELPADHRRTLNVMVVGVNDPLQRMSVDFLDRLHDATGTPKFYGFSGSQMLLRPAPAAVGQLVHRYKRRETDLAAASDEALIDSSFAGTVVEYAAMLAYRRLRDTAEAERARAEYERMLATMKAEMGLESMSEGGGVVPRPVPPVVAP